MSESCIHPSSENIAVFQATALEGPLMMLNLSGFKADGGAEEYARYSEAATPHLDKCGANVNYMGNVANTLSGDEQFDQILLVEYPPQQAFIEMSSNPDNPGEVRIDALLDSRLICTQPTDS